MPTKAKPPGGASRDTQKAAEFVDLVRKRIEKLRPKLLDLTRRNPLLCAPVSLRTNALVRAVDELPDVLFKRLAEGESFQIVPLPPLAADPRDEQTRTFQDALQNARLTDPDYLAALDKASDGSDQSSDALARAERELKDRLRDQFDLPKRQTVGNPSLAQHARNNGISPSYDLPLPDEKHEDGRHEDSSIQTLLLPDVLERRVTGLMSKQRTWEQETGINVLQIAFGFLEWSETNSDQKNLAPLVLMPVKLVKNKTSRGPEFHLTSLGEQTEGNLVLKEKCASEFDVKIPDYANEGVEEYLAKIAPELPPGSTWRVRRQVAIGVFPSARLAMYYDLDTSEGVFDQHKIIEELLAGTDVVATDSPFADDYEVDKIEIEKKVPFLVRSADSSQFSTLVDVADGVNLAVEGPPGTGKSQTIVNAIAAAMAAGKKVLFVAEKTAALDVVRSRLAAVSLGEFLLPLLANRSSKEQVMEAIRQRLDMTVEMPVEYERKVADLRARKQSLSEYVSLMASTFHRTGLTVHRILGRAIRTEPTFRGLPDGLQKLPIQLPRYVSALWFREAAEGARTLEAAWTAAQNSSTAWNGVTVPHLDPFKAERIINASVQAARSAGDLHVHRARLAQFGLSPALPVKEINLATAALDAATSWDMANPEVLRGLSTPDALQSVGEFVDNCRTLTATLSELSVLLDEPLAEHWEETLARLVALAREVKLDRLSDSALTEKVQEAESNLSSAQTITNAFTPFITRFPAAANWPRQVLRDLSKLAHNTATEVFALRNRKLLDAYALSILRSAIAEAEALEAARNQLSDTFVLIKPPQATAVVEHLGRIKNSHFFSFFSGEFREAKRFYVSLSKTGKYDRATAIEHLTALGEWAIKAEKFASNAEMQDLLGKHFDGLYSDTSILHQLHNFYRAIAAGLSPLTHKDQIELLHTADPHELRLLPVEDQPAYAASGFATIEDARTAISALEKWLVSVREKAEEIEAHCRRLKPKSEVPIKVLKEIGTRIPTVQKMHRSLTSHPAAARALGSLFKGTASHTVPGVTESLAIARHLGELTQSVRNAIIDAVSSAALDDLKTTLVSVSLCHLRAAGELQDLTKQTGVTFSAISADADWAKIRDALLYAAGDKSGLFAHAALFTALEDLKGHPLREVADALLAGGQGLSSLCVSADALFSRALAKEVYSDHSAILSRYTGATLNAARSQFALLDEEIHKLTHAHIRSKIRNAAKPPSGNGRGPKSTWTGYSLINNEIEKRKRHIPLRDLTARSGQALLELMPCWMMSPLAVAQYIPDDMLFDLVVIDEASQMTPEDALGAVRRGRQVMVVGDTNQLPPTTFFKKLLDQDDEDEDDLVVEESILDMANSAFRPKRRLRWHYRSHDSSLIQFSNEYVYDRSLIFFPSPTEGRPDMGVKFLKVDGLYASGTNPIEARTLVNHALQFMKRFPERSLGIVTMNQKQRELIEAEVNEALARDSKASEYVAAWTTRNDGLEYFFVKNLENVQGDERDVIFIGTVYGPAVAGGKVAQKFGPINGVAGKRRLNVLFTRAKKLIVTFSSMNADDIREDGSNAGVSLFRKWIEYSATGMLRPNADTGREADSDFELHVMDQLRSIGCEVVPQVGVTGYYIDIGVKHPKWPHGFILGIECDGATYHSSRSARDRDRLRQEVLESLGWTLYRIWSTDWFNDPISETAKLRKVVEARLKQLQDSIIELPPEFFVNSATKPAEATGPKFEMAGLPEELAGVSHPKALFTSEDQGIGLGDVITVRYLDGSKQTRVFTLSERNDPDKGLLGTMEPLGDVLQGAVVGDEVQFEVRGQLRAVRVEKIERATSAI